MFLTKKGLSNRRRCEPRRGQKTNGPLPEAYGPLKLDRRDARATTFARRGRTAVEPAAGSPCVYPWCRNLTYFKLPGHLPAPFPGAGYPLSLFPRPSSRAHPPVSLCPRPSAVPLFKALTTTARGESRTPYKDGQTLSANDNPAPPLVVHEVPDHSMQDGFGPEAPCPARSSDH